MDVPDRRPLRRPFLLAVTIAALFALVRVASGADAVRPLAPPAASRGVGNVGAEGRPGRGESPEQESALITGSCRTDNPFFAGSLFADGASGAADDAVVAFRDTESEAERIVLATQTDVGTVFGLAADPDNAALYAAAYHRQGSSFGPGGPGAVYRIDLESMTTSRLISLDAGPDRHGQGDLDKWVGISSLGDMALSPDGATLFVANLFRGRIDRVSTADGAYLGSIRHGGTQTNWAAGARLFGLTEHEGALFHAVTDSAAVTLDGIPTVHVFRSDLDGGGMTQVAELALGAWEQWADGPARVKQPMAVAMDFDAMGRMVVGVRNRAADFAEERLPATLLKPGGPLGTGEIFWLTGAGDVFDMARSAPVTAQSQWLSGGVAAMPGLDLSVLSSDLSPGLGGGDIAAWLDGTGALVRSERMSPRQASGSRPAPEGGVEPLCARGPLDEDLAATATRDAAGTQAASATAQLTRAAGTATAWATVALGTQTARAATRTALPSNPVATATAAVAHLAQIGGSCSTTRPYFAVTCFAQDVDIQVLLNEPSIVAFNGTQKIPLAGQLDTGATYGLAHDLSRNHLYAGAYLKRGAPFGPGGPGAIYRVDLNTGAVTVWATLSAGFDPHTGIGDLDRGASPYTGRLSLGDVEVDDRFTTLFVVNLYDRLVHRFSLPDGTYLGAFATPFTGSGHPFGLGFRAGWLYMGFVTDSGPTGWIYRCRPDGSQMEEVLSFSLAYGHNPPWVPWSPPTAVDSYNYGTGEPQLSDIEFGPTGDLLIGLRDRMSDATTFNSGTGDLLPARGGPGAWQVVTAPEFYAEDNIHDEPMWGSMALAPSRDVTVATVLDPIEIVSGGIAWFDNRTGKVVDEQTIYVTQGNSPTFSKAAGLGDVEGLCPNPDVPTPGPTETLTPSPTVTLTPTATATRVPSPIYLPVMLGERCRDRTRHADIVLVMDVSTSMLRPSGQGRPKLDALQDAARRFLATVDFTPNDEGAHDQVAIVFFNDTAGTVQRMTSDRDRLESAIDRLPERMAQGTRLDLAIAAGVAALDDPARIVANAGTIVLLTDGVPNRVPTPQTGGSQDDTVLDEARKAKAAGIDIFTIGVGRPDAPDPADRINADLLREVASRPDMFFQAPDAEDLERIYTEVAVTIACPRGRHRWGEPWP